MSLEINIKATPPGLTAHIDIVTEEVVLTTGGPIGGRELARMSMNDFCILAGYVLQGSDLWSEKDPRLSLVQSVRKYSIGPGFNEGFQRIMLGKPKLQLLNCDEHPPDISTYAVPAAVQ